MNLNNLSRLIREARLRRPADVAYRLYHAALNRTGILRLRFPANQPRERDFLNALELGVATNMTAFARHFDQREQPQFYCDANALQPARNGDTDCDSLLIAANAIVERRFRAAGRDEIRFVNEIDWMHCLNNADGRWPAVHWSRVNFRDAAQLGDVKSCWDWNRHHCFVTLGRAYQRTADERYVDAFVSQLASWCRQNPPEIGVHYASNLEIGLRMVSWLWAHHLMASSSRYTNEARGQLHLFLFYMARHLARNLRYTEFTGRNNHLIGDASCLAVWCLLYPEVKSARNWLRRALRVLWGSLDEQVFPDGMHFELSFGYQQFVIELLLQVVLLMRRQGNNVPDDKLHRIERMLDLLAKLVQPNGELPNFNDEDGGYVWAFHDCPSRRVDMLLRVGAEVFDRPDWLSDKARTDVDEIHWLIGHGPRQQKAAATSDSDQLVIEEFKASSLLVVRGAQPHSHFALFNNQPDPFPRSGHNHASLLQLLLWIDGVQILCDGGTFRYNGDEGFRNALRGTRAHNTVVVDGLDQADAHRNFGWTSTLRPGRTDWLERDNLIAIDAYHDSYGRPNEEVRHRRSVIWVKRPFAVIVRDELSGSGTHDFEQMWHFPDDLRISEVADGSYQIEKDDAGFAAQVLVGEEASCELSRGDPAQKWTWESPRYGVIRPRTSLTVSWRNALPCSRVTAFYPQQTAAAGELPMAHVASDQLCLFDGSILLNFANGRIECSSIEFMLASQRA